MSTAVGRGIVVFSISWRCELDQLCLAVAGANRSDPMLASSAGAAIELLHCASLVHDDLPCLIMQMSVVGSSRFTLNLMKLLF